MEGRGVERTGRGGVTRKWLVVRQKAKRQKEVMYEKVRKGVLDLISARQNLAQGSSTEEK